MKRFPAVPLLLVLSLAVALLPGCEYMRKAKAVRNAAARFETALTPVPDPQGRPYFPEGGMTLQYGGDLRAMGEPSLMAELPPGSTFALRFTRLSVLPFPDHVMVRIQDRDGVVTGRAVRQVKLVDSWGKGVKRVSIQRDPETVEDRALTVGKELPEPIRKLISRPGFWRPLNDKESRMGMAGKRDGSVWIFEWRDLREYRMLELWDPHPAPAYYKKREGWEKFRAGVRSMAPYYRLRHLLLREGNLKEDDGGDSY